MDGIVSVRVLEADGRLEWWDVFCGTDGEASTVEVVSPSPGRQRFHGEGADLFDALRALRLELEERGAFLLCAGAARNAHQSGALASFHDGAVVYLLEAGWRPKRQAWIFDPAEPEDAGTVAEQVEFFERWVRGRQTRGPFSNVLDWLYDLWHKVK
ncbi:hypothetical protein [Streptomyces sp. ICBB 8177]|uniref:hypothetical protein n=1 Tax=Streptomyces sp. ICBB 8177 TaxID=563922 RepID=UPI000D680C85|nr:hypothetical protein [Streptomyces sp. ICBB 8177]PWI43385.1 hypothetical protein CK485_14670 [Streptomyces sp. ICBB 8177]